MTTWSDHGLTMVKATADAGAFGSSPYPYLGSRCSIGEEENRNLTVFRRMVWAHAPRLNLLEAPLGLNVVHEMPFMVLGYKDPTDRFLVATAKAYDLTRVTSDRRLLQIEGLRLLPISKGRRQPS